VMLVTVEVQDGKLQGVYENGAVSFKGIPYAADTGGKNRFLAPEPVASWAGVREALQFGDRCPQPIVTMAQAPVFSWYDQTSAFSENCCSLNIYSPDLNPNARRPVMFYIHGGGFSRGGSGAPGVDGCNLAKFNDIVVITINHRLNAFGFNNMAYLNGDFPDAANAGLLDIIAALTWVKNNVTAFGGDPECVTIFGQSGGGSKVMLLLAMPGAKGLFHRAINMSGVSGLDPRPAAETEELTDELFKILGIQTGDISKLQKVPADAFLSAHLKAVAAINKDEARPVIDGLHLLAGPMTSEGLAIHASVPLMMGTTETEATFFFRNDKRHFYVTSDQVKARIKAQYDINDAKVEAIIAGYLGEDPNRTPAAILFAFASDVLFRGRMLRAADAKANAKQAPVYLYNFVWKVAVDGGIWRSPHCADIPFAFGNVDKATMMTGPGYGPIETSLNMMSAFATFARTGNPNNSRLPTWEPYNTARPLAASKP
jgi:para-nitrobenzyl esterase